MDDLDLIKTVHDGKLQLATAISIVNTGDHAQFVHQYEKVPGEKYTVRHKREGCAFCDAVDAIFESLDRVEQYAYATAREKATT